MKKLFLLFSFGVLGVSFLAVEDSFALTYTDSESYWQKWIRRIPSRTRRYRGSRVQSTSTWGANYYTDKNKSLRSSDSGETPLSRKNSIFRSPIISAQTSSSKYKLKLTPIAIRQKQTVSLINEDPIRIFELGVRNSSDSFSTDFVEAMILDTVTFQMYDNNGIASDPERFRLEVSYFEWNGVGAESEALQFQEDGSVTVKFHNARVAKGESLKFNVDIFVYNPDETPHIPGSLRLRILSAEAQTEQTKRKIIPEIAGSALSEKIAFNPTSQVPTQTSVFSGTSVTTPYSQALSGGDTAVVLALGMEAHYDDMLIEEVTLRDDLGDGSIESFVNLVRAIDVDTGYILGQARFLEERATFHFTNAIRVDRGGKRRIAFEVRLASTIDHSSQNTLFRLNVLPEDMVVRSASTGRDLGNSDKNFSINREQFWVVKTGSKMQVAPSAVQPVGFSVNEDSYNSIYRFKIKNTENDEFSVSRISLNVQLEGLDYPGGRSADDFELKQIIGGREVSGAAFSPSLGNGNVIVFDASSEVLVGRRSESEFLLKIRLSDVLDGTPRGDSVAVSVVRDASFQTGTLASLKNGNANFIWSDLSDYPHTTDSEDWLSGYMLSGLSGNVQINRRYGY